MQNEDGLEYVELPRTRIGGLKRGPVERLLQRISEDFGRLQRENDRLSAANERLSTTNERLWASVEHLEMRPEPKGQQAWREPIGIADNPAAALLEAAQRAARELRESTRSECQLTLKKVRSHAMRLQLDLERERAEVRAEIDHLLKVRRRVDESMRASLREFRHILLTATNELSIFDMHGGTTFGRSSDERPAPSNKTPISKPTA